MADLLGVPEFGWPFEGRRLEHPGLVYDSDGTIYAGATDGHPQAVWGPRE